MSEDLKLKIEGEMKNFIVLTVLVLGLSLGANVFAKDHTDDFIKFISKHDIPKKARDLDSDSSTSLFWDMVLKDNPIINKLFKDISKKKGAEKEALDAVGRIMSYDYRLEVDIVPELQGICDTLMMDMGIPTSICDMHVIYDPSPNAFSTLTDKGFVICLNTGLLEKLDYDYWRIMGVAAHEFAHGAFFHHLRTEYETAKKQRKDKILGGIAAGLTAVSAGIDAYTATTLGSKYDYKVYAERLDRIENDMTMSSLRFKYRYYREEELEADLIAQRFMEFLGQDGKYREALQMISSAPTYFWYNEESSTHPATEYRLEFLDFISANPHYGFGSKKIKEPTAFDRAPDAIYQ